MCSGTSWPAAHHSSRGLTNSQTGRCLQTDSSTDRRRTSQTEFRTFHEPRVSRSWIISTGHDVLLQNLEQMQDPVLRLIDYGFGGVLTSFVWDRPLHQHLVPHRSQSHGRPPLAKPLREMASFDLCRGNGVVGSIDADRLLLDVSALGRNCKLSIHIDNHVRNCPNPNRDHQDHEHWQTWWWGWQVWQPKCWAIHDKTDQRG